MKRNLLVAMALALLVTTAASAQTVKLNVTVPFSFIVNGAALPAGEYSVSSMDDHGTVLAIHNLNSKATSLVSSIACVKRDYPTQSKLIFRRYGDRYFLNQIWTEGNNDGRELPPSAREKEVARDFSMREVVLLAAQR
jgi:hypothetical protein